MREGSSQRARVDADLIGPALEHPVEVVQRVDAAAHGEGDEDLAGHPGKDVGEEGAALGAGRDVVEHQLVGTGRVVHPGHLHRVGHILDALEVRSLDDPPAADVQTGNDAFCDHGLAPYFCTSATQRLRSSAPVYRLLPRMAAAVPISSSSSSSFSEEIPPLAVMATPGTSFASWR